MHNVNFLDFKKEKKNFIDNHLFGQKKFFEYFDILINFYISILENAL